MAPSVMPQVRDAALGAAGKCAAAFPEECRAALPELLKLWSAHLDDNIASVRANAAAALGDALRAYKQELLDEILPLMRSGPHSAQPYQLQSERRSGGFSAHGDSTVWGAVVPAGKMPLAAAQSNSTASASTAQQLQAPAGAVPQPPGAQVHCAGLLHTIRMAFPSAQQEPMDARREMLPKAREQDGGTGSGSAALAPQPQAPTRAAPPPPGARVVSAEPRKVEQGGLFQDVGLTRAKDTGGIGESTFLLCISCDCMTEPMPSFACHRNDSCSDWVMWSTCHSVRSCSGQVFALAGLY